jgi:hypothetical protein
MRERYPELFQFFGGYFNQDWDLEAEDNVGVVRVFKAQNSRKYTFEVADELDAFLALPLSETETREIVWRSFGCDYGPIAHGEEVRSWLGRIRAELASN